MRLLLINADGGHRLMFKFRCEDLFQALGGVTKKVQVLLTFSTSNTYAGNRVLL